MIHKITLIALLAALSVAVFPPSMIATDNIEFNSLTPAGGAASYTASLGGIFTVTPKVSVVWTGFEYPALTSSILFGWTVDLSLISSSQLQITVTPLSTFTNLKFKWVATQGDHLQVFPLSATGIGVEPTYFTIPFDYSAKVAFDSSNLPIEVSVQVLCAGLQWMYSGAPQYSGYIPLKLNLSGSWAPALDPQPYADLYGPAATFNTNGTLSLYESADIPSTQQLTLMIHRVMLPSETTTPATGSGKKFDSATNFDGSYLWDLSNPTYNYLSASAGTSLTGIIGTIGYLPLGGTKIGAINCSIYVNFTSISAVTNTRAGYNVAFAFIFAYFYVQDCHANCITCNGILPTQCLTCTGNINAWNGMCICPPAYFIDSTVTDFVCVACPYGCSVCTSLASCTSCEQRSYRVKDPDSTSGLCPCLDGFYEDATGHCVVCPTNQHCKTCQLSGGNVICTDCDCSKHRVLTNSNACPCMSSYTDNSGASDYCQRI